MKIRTGSTLVATLLGADVAFMAAWAVWYGNRDGGAYPAVLCLALGVGVGLAIRQVMAMSKVLGRLTASQKLLEEFAKGNMTGRLDVPADGDEIGEVFLAHLALIGWHQGAVPLHDLRHRLQNRFPEVGLIGNHAPPSRRRRRRQAVRFS